MGTEVGYLNVSYTDVTAVDLRHVDASVGLAFSEEVSHEEFPAETSTGVRVVLENAGTLAGYGPAVGGKPLWHREFKSAPKVAFWRGYFD